MDTNVRAPAGQGGFSGLRGKRPCDVELLPVFRYRVKIVDFEDWKPVANEYDRTLKDADNQRS